MKTGEPETRNLFREAACCYVEALVDALVEDALRVRVDRDVPPLLNIPQADIVGNHPVEWMLAEARVRGRGESGSSSGDGDSIDDLCRKHGVRPRAWNCFVKALQHPDFADLAYWVKLRRLCATASAKCVVLPPDVEQLFMRNLRWKKGKEFSRGRDESVASHVSDCEPCQPRCIPLRRGTLVCYQALDAWFDDQRNRAEMRRVLDEKRKKLGVTAEAWNTDSRIDATWEFVRRDRHFDCAIEMGLDDSVTGEKVAVWMSGFSGDACKPQTSRDVRRAGRTVGKEGTSWSPTDRGDGDPSVHAQVMEAFSRLSTLVCKAVDAAVPRDKALVLFVNELFGVPVVEFGKEDSGKPPSQREARDSEVFRSIVWGFDIPKKWLERSRRGGTSKAPDMGEFQKETIRSALGTKYLGGFVQKPPARECLKAAEKLSLALKKGCSLDPLSGDATRVGMAEAIGREMSDQEIEVFGPLCRSLRLAWSSTFNQVCSGSQDSEALTRVLEVTCHKGASGSVNSARKLRQMLVNWASRIRDEVPRSFWNQLPIVEVLQEIGVWLSRGAPDLSDPPESACDGRVDGAVELGMCEWDSGTTEADEPCNGSLHEHCS